MCTTKYRPILLPERAPYMMQINDRLKIVSYLVMDSKEQTDAKTN
jgi:hypothetical protein